MTKNVAKQQARPRRQQHAARLTAHYRTCRACWRQLQAIAGHPSLRPFVNWRALALDVAATHLADGGAS
jgi:hypothetical protein